MEGIDNKIKLFLENFQNDPISSFLKFKFNLNDDEKIFICRYNKNNIKILKKLT